MREEVQAKQIANTACDTLTESLALSNRTADELTEEIETLKNAACQREIDFHHALEKITTTGEQLTFEIFMHDKTKKEVERKD